MLDSVIRADRLDGGRPVSVELVAEAEDRHAVAERFDWIEVGGLTAVLEARRVASDTYEVTGKVEAAIVQRCRVTGAPVSESLAFDVHERFMAGSAGEGAAEIDPLAVSVESIVDGAIPVGEMVAQLVGLEASPWPRDPEAGVPEAPDLPQSPAHPFASLAELKKKH